LKWLRLHYKSPMKSNVTHFTMKRHLVLIPAFLFLSIAGFGQKLYFGLTGGYGFPVAGMELGTNSTYSSTISSPIYTNENVRGSLGKGVNAGGYIGYMLNENFGVETGVNYLFSASVKTTYSMSYPDPTMPISYTEEYKMRARMLRITPALRMTTGSGSLKPYMRAGMVIGLAGKMFVEGRDTHTDTGLSSVREIEAEFSGGVSFGIHGALGATFALSDHLSLFGEISGFGQSHAMTKGKYTKYKRDGVDELPTMDVNEKEWTFSDKVESSDNSDSSKPATELKNYFPFSSIGLNIGIHYSF
jgi:hypothetical protein